MKKVFRWLGGIAAVIILIVAIIWVTIEPGLDASSIPSKVFASPSPVYSNAVAEGRMRAGTLVAEQNLPGLSLAVSVDGEIIWAEGFGWADYENRIPITPESQFRIGSISKVFTATAAALLYEEGLLDIDVPVQQYIPMFPEKEWPISTRQLLGHVAGIRHFNNSREALSKVSCANDRERLALFADDPLNFQPGTAYGYSTYGYVLVGAIVTTLAEESLPDYVQHEILNPLGMHSTVVDEKGQRVPQLAHLYFPRIFHNTYFGLRDAPEVDLSCICAGGGFISTPLDLVRFGSAMLKDDLLKQETISLLQTPLQLKSGESTQVGLGWAERFPPLGIGQTPTRVVGASGNVAGGTSLLLTIPAHGLVIALATNVSFAEFYPISLQLADIFIQSKSARKR